MNTQTGLIFSTDTSGELVHTTTEVFRAIERAGLDEELGFISQAGLQHGGDIPPLWADKTWKRVAHWLQEVETRSFEPIRTNWTVAMDLATLLLEKEYFDGGQVVEILQEIMKQERRT